MSTREQRQIRELVDGLRGPDAEKPLPTLRPEEPRGGIPAARGYAEKQYQPGSGAGASGIAGPLTEVPNTRTYHEDIVYQMYSSDHLLAVEICPLASIRMLDAEEREVVFNFAAPGSIGG